MKPKVPAEPPTGVIGLDLGGTKIAAALVGPDGVRQGVRERREHSNRGPEAVLDEIVALLDDVAPDGVRHLEAVGVGAAAQVEEATGLVHHAPNLRWKDYRLGPELHDRTGVPVFVVNDARAATLGEWWYGAGRGVEELLVVSVGTGVGGSIVAGGRLLEGASGAAGEVGHSMLVAGGRKCHCPGRGCLEAYVGGWAIAERAREAMEADPPASAALRSASTGWPDARTVFATARAGDPLAVRLTQETATLLGHGVAGLVNAINPARVVLGGGVIEGWPELVHAVEEAVRTSCQPPAARVVDVRRVELGHDAVLVGAAALARQRLAAGGGLVELRAPWAPPVR